MKKNTFVEGTIISYILIVITKLLGALYVIPFYNIVGEEGWVLNTYAYNVYNLFLNISTSGIPVAVAIIIAEYNALKMINERDYAYKVATKVISIISVIAFLIMFIFAKYIALFFINGVEVGSNLSDIVMVIRVVSFCILIIPFLSITRGYLQGNKYVSPSSFSQLLEQIIRIAVVLIGSYVAINVLNMTSAQGVSVSLLGAFLGGVVAFIYLRSKIRKNKESFDEGKTKDSLKVNQREVIKKIIFYSIPIVIVSLTQNIYEIVDFKLILKGLVKIGISGAKAESYATMITASAPKICMIINALALGLVASIIPFIVNEFVNKNKENMNKLFNQALSTILYISIPLSCFIILFSKELYFIFYEYSLDGSIILITNSIVSIFFSINLVINTMLQSMKRYKLIYINSICGLVLNAVLDIPLIMLFNKVGVYPFIATLVATICGQLLSISIVMISLRKEFDFKYSDIYSNCAKVLINTLPAVIVMYLITLIKADSTLMILAKIALGGLSGVIIYLFITYKDKLMEDVFKQDMLKKVLSRFRRSKDE